MVYQTPPHSAYAHKYRTFFCLFFAIILALLLPLSASAENLTSGALTGVAAGTGLSKVSSVNAAIGNVIGAALAFSGVLFFILALYGGITWMTAAGNQDNVKKGLKILLSAIFGLIVILSAYAITRFVFQAAGPQVNDPANTSVNTTSHLPIEVQNNIFLVRK